MVTYHQLKLENQLCFPLYAASRMITRAYKPLLDSLNITYPQYLVLLILWEEDDLTVNHIASKLHLKTNTITPLLKRMEMLKLIVRERSVEDERKVKVRLTEKALKLKDDASTIPGEIFSQVQSEELDIDTLINLKSSLEVMIESLSNA